LFDQYPGEQKKTIMQWSALIAVKFGEMGSEPNDAIGAVCNLSAVKVRHHFFFRSKSRGAEATWPMKFEV